MPMCIDTIAKIWSQSKSSWTNGMMNMGFTHMIKDYSSVKKNKPGIGRQVPHVPSKMVVKMKSTSCDKDDTHFYWLGNVQKGKGMFGFDLDIVYSWIKMSNLTQSTVTINTGNENIIKPSITTCKHCIYRLSRCFPCEVSFLVTISMSNQNKCYLAKLEIMQNDSIELSFNVSKWQVRYVCHCRIFHPERKWHKCSNSNPEFSSTRCSSIIWVYVKCGTVNR